MQCPRKASLREAFHEVFSPVGQHNISKFGHEPRRCCIEITLRHRRIRLSLHSEKSLNIPPVFLKQSVGSVLRMALEMHKHAPLFLLHERVHSTFGRLSQNVITACRQCLSPHFVPSRMRKTYLFASTTV